MIEINLIPDVKQEFLKAQRTRNAVATVAGIVGASAVVATVVLGLTYGGIIAVGAIQDNTIKNEFAKLEKVEDLNNTVTVQNQLSKVSGHFTEQQIFSRMIDIVNATNPGGNDAISVTDLTVDPASKLVTVQAIAPGGYSSTEAYKKLIENTKIQYQNEDGTTTEEDLASGVAIGETNYSEDADSRRVLNFTLTFTYTDNTLMRSAKGFRIQTPSQPENVTDSATRITNSLVEGQQAATEGEN